MMKQKYKPMECPICGKFYFSELQEGDREDNLFCDMCGWNYDLNQTDNPDLQTGRNQMSQNEYKEWYKKRIAEDPDYRYWDQFVPDPVPHKCPVCGKYEFEDENSFDICPFCGWEDDGVMTDDPDYAGGANSLSLNDYKKRYEEIISKDPDYKWEKSNTAY